MLFVIKLNPEFSSELLEEAKTTLALSIITATANTAIRVSTFLSRYRRSLLSVILMMVFKIRQL